MRRLAMNAKRYLIASIVLFVFILLIEWLLHGVILKGMYTGHPELFNTKQVMSSRMLWMLLGYLVLAFGFTLVFVKGYENKGIAEGFRYGLYVGLAFGVGPFLIEFAVFPYTGTMTLVWCIGILAEMILSGIVVAALYKPRNRPEF